MAFVRLLSTPEAFSLTYLILPGRYGNRRNIFFVSYVHLWQVETKHPQSQHRPNSSYLQWRLDHLQRLPKSNSIALNELARAPPSSPAATTARPISYSFTQALHLPDSPWTYLTLCTSLNSGGLYSTLERQLFPRSAACPAGVESCCGSRVLAII